MNCYPCETFLHTQEYKPVTIERVINTAVEYFGINQNVLTSKWRKREVVEARQMCMYALVIKTRFSLKKIGEAFGGRDHSTVINARKVVGDLRDTDPDFKHRLREFMEAI